MSFSERIGTFRQGDPAPLYLQLQQIIREAVRNNVLRQDEAIPAERDLAQEYGISRITVRKAISGLVEEGLLSRRWGSGTFVSGRVEKNFSAITSFSEDMLSRGRRPSNSWVSRTTGTVTPEEALSLSLSPGATVYRFQRIRYADDIPMAFEYSTVPGYCLPSIDAVGNSLYEALEKAGNRPVRALQRLRAVPFAREQAEPLGVEPGHAGLFIERRGFLRDGRPVEFTQSYYRGDVYDLVAELTDL